MPQCIQYCIVCSFACQAWFVCTALVHIQISRRGETMVNNEPYIAIFSLRLYEVQHEDRDYRRVETLCLHHLNISNGAYRKWRCCETKA